MSELYSDLSDSDADAIVGALSTTPSVSSQPSPARDTESSPISPPLGGFDWYFTRSRDEESGVEDLDEVNTGHQDTHSALFTSTRQRSYSDESDGPTLAPNLRMFTNSIPLLNTGERGDVILDSSSGYSSPSSSVASTETESSAVPIVGHENRAPHGSSELAPEEALSCEYFTGYTAESDIFASPDVSPVATPDISPTVRSPAAESSDARGRIENSDAALAAYLADLYVHARARAERLAPNLYIVTDFDPITLSTLHTKWVHVTTYPKLLHEAAQPSLCDCNDKNPRGCLHSRLVAAAIETLEQRIPKHPAIPVATFAVESGGNLPVDTIRLLSVMAGQGLDDGRRAFVALDNRGGFLHCLKPCKKGVKCIHELRAHRFISENYSDANFTLARLDDIPPDQAVLQMDELPPPLLRGQRIGSACIASAGHHTGSTEYRPSGKEKKDFPSRSYRPIPYPIWASLQTDRTPRCRIIPISELPDILELDVHSKCSCGRIGTGAIVTKSCNVFDIVYAERRKIQTRTCDCSSLAGAGPDLGDVGYLNLNNEVVISHSLLYDCSSRITKSECPVGTLQRMYSDAYLQESCSRPEREFIDFMSAYHLRNGFFNYLKLLQDTVAFNCPQCEGSDGKYNIVIADGVSLAFPSNRKLEGLRPPTVPSMSFAAQSLGIEEYIQQPGPKPLRGMNFILTSNCRKAADSAILHVAQIHKLTTALKKREQPFSQGATTHAEVLHVDDTTHRQDNEDDDDNSGEDDDELLDQIERQLQTFQDELGSALKVLCDSPDNQNKTFARAALALLDCYSKAHPEASLVFQLLQQLASNTSVLCFCGPNQFRLILRVLQCIEDNPTLVDAPQSNKRLDATVMLGRAIPVLGDLFTFSNTSGTAVPSWLIDLAIEVAIRSKTISALLNTHATTAPDPSAFNRVEGDWRVTGSFYGLPQVRGRPIYTRLRNEGGAVGVNGDGWGTQAPSEKGRNNRSSYSVRNSKRSLPDDQVDKACQKFYANYKQNSLTGGIMALWCPHGVCLGFHLIPAAEGRNDVFSALYTHFETAPSYVVYDFACALAPYCYSRELNYFKDTTFIIDRFHQSDHSSCSAASWASTYEKADPKLKGLNTSAAESGNARLRLIRTMVRASGQQRGILLIHHFLSIYNRARQRSEHLKT